MPRLHASKSAPVTAQTTNATPLAVNLFDLASPGHVEALDGKGIYIEVRLIAQSAGGGVFAGKIVGSFKRISGTLSMIGSTGVPVTIPVTDLAAAVILQATGTVIQALATGILATTIDWTFYPEVSTD